MSGTSSNVVDRLLELARTAPERRALVLARPDGEDRELTYGELARRVRAVAAGFAEEGLRPDDRVLLLVPMSLELYVALLGVLAVGAVAVFVDPWVGRKRIAELAAHAEPRAIIGTSRTLLLRWTSRRLRAPFAVTTGRSRWGGWAAEATLSRLEERGSSAPANVQPRRADDLALVTLTSGSSGEPKGVERSHGFLLAQHEALAAEVPVAPGAVDLTMFPIFALHDLASGGTALVPPFDVARPDEVDAPEVLAWMARREVATGVASPPFWDRLAAAVLEQASSRPGLRRLVSGGAPVSDAQLRNWRRAFPGTEIRIVFGSTEAEPVASISAEERLALNDSEEGQERRGFCVGRLAPGVRARVLRIHRGPILLDSRGFAPWQVEPGAVGELVVAGEHVGRGYFRSERAFAESKIRDGEGVVWHRMGDTGWFDPAGRFWLVGRLHSTILRAGEPIHAQLVEQVAQGEDPEIRRVAAVGLPDPALGERVVLVVETRRRSGKTREAVAGRLARAGLHVDEIRLERRSLPVDPRHRSKIDYMLLRRRLEVDR
jgi:acyl-CoA synthetase (AMP-forming)/AMP-acid ligase II